MGSYRALSPPGTSYLVLALSADDAESKQLMHSDRLAERSCCRLGFDGASSSVGP